MSRLFADSDKRFMSNKINRKDLYMNGLTANLSVRSMSEQISHKFLLKICVWAKLIKV